ncbi:MAG: hypothetical protein WD342_01740 [Verrucomicrobiales bacterium]
MRSPFRMMAIMSLKSRFRRRELPLLACIVAAGLPAFGFAEASRLESLSAGFETATSRLNQRYESLDEAYINALERLQESETRAGHLSNVIEVKNEIDTFTREATFHADDFQERLSSFEPLKRIQTTYAEQRQSIDEQLHAPRRELVTRYLEELEKLEADLTRSGDIETAIETKNAREAFRKDSRYARLLREGDDAEKGLLTGRIKFVTKGELEIYLNGKSLRYRNSYDGPDNSRRMRITGETRGEQAFQEGDLLFIRASSSAVFRGIAMMIVANGQSAYLPIRKEDLAYLGKDAKASRVTSDAVKERKGEGIVSGATDGIMVSEWAAIGLRNADESGSEWFQGPTSEDWHGWGTILGKEMLKPLDSD